MLPSMRMLHPFNRIYLPPVSRQPARVPTTATRWFPPPTSTPTERRGSGRAQSSYLRAEPLHGLSQVRLIFSLITNGTNSILVRGLPLVRDLFSTTTAVGSSTSHATSSAATIDRQYSDDDSH